MIEGQAESLLLLLAARAVLHRNFADNCDETADALARLVPESEKKSTVGLIVSLLRTTVEIVGAVNEAAISATLESAATLAAAGADIDGFLNEFMRLGDSFGRDEGPPEDQP